MKNEQPKEYSLTQGDYTLNTKLDFKFLVGFTKDEAREIANQLIDFSDSL